MQINSLDDTVVETIIRSYSAKGKLFDYKGATFYVIDGIVGAGTFINAGQYHGPIYGMFKDDTFTGCKDLGKLLTLNDS